MCAIVSLPENFGTNTGWYGWSWSTETPSPGILSVSFLMEPDFFIFVLHSLFLAVPNMNDAQRFTSSFNSRNLNGRTPSFSSLNKYLECRWDNLSCQDFNSCFKGDRPPGNMVFSIFWCEILLFVYIFLWGNCNWSNIWYIHWL